MCVGGIETAVIIYFSVQGNSSFDDVVYSKLEVMGCSRIEGEGALGLEPADLGAALAVLAVTLAT